MSDEAQGQIQGFLLPSLSLPGLVTEPPASFFSYSHSLLPQVPLFPSPIHSLFKNKQTNKERTTNNFVMGKFQNVQKYTNPQGAMRQLQQACFTYILPGELSKCADVQAPPKMGETVSGLTKLPGRLGTTVTNLAPPLGCSLTSSPVWVSQPPQPPTSPPAPTLGRFPSLTQII